MDTQLQIQSKAIYREYKKILTEKKCPLQALTYLKSHRHEFDINSAFDKNESLLYLAIDATRPIQKGGLPELCRYLINEGIDVNMMAGLMYFKDGSVKPHHADDDFTDTVLIRLLSRSRFHRFDSSGRDVVVHTALVNDLLLAGADVDIRTNPMGSSALMMCARHVLSVELFERILNASRIDNSINWVENLSDFDGLTGKYSAAHCAAEGGHLDYLQILLDRGADFQAKEAEDSLTPLGLLYHHYPDKWAEFLHKNPSLFEAEMTHMSDLFNKVQVKPLGDSFHASYENTLKSWHEKRLLSNVIQHMPQEQKHFKL